MNDVVNHPQHYTQGGVECIDALAAATVGLEGIQAVCTANAIKYLWRWKRKNGAEDIDKAIWYLNRLKQSIKEEEQAEVKNAIQDIETNVCDMCDKPMSIWDVADMLVRIREHGGEANGLVLLCDTVTKFQLCSEAAINDFRVYRRHHSVRGMIVERVETPAGCIDLHESVGLPAGTAVLVNFNDDSYVKQLKKHEKMHGKFINILKRPR